MLVFLLLGNVWPDSNKTIKWGFMIIIKLLVLLLSSSIALAEVPQLVSYQGYLTDSQGSPKQGTANLSFTFYDEVSGGRALWGPQTFTRVPLINGSFNIILGTTDSNGAPLENAFQAADSYLQITDLGADTSSVADDEVILPRQQILSAPYAMEAKSSVNSRYEVPIGTVITSILPYSKFVQTVNDPAAFDKTLSKWAPADGRPIDGSRLAILAERANIPNFQGVFERGLNNFDPSTPARTGEYADPEGARVVGVEQRDEYESHRHNQFVRGIRKGHSGEDNDTSPISMLASVGGDFKYKVSIGDRARQEADAFPGQSKGGSETRPNNIAVYKYIRIN